jgi:hypothetical protein
MVSPAITLITSSMCSASASVFGFFVSTYLAIVFKASIGLVIESPCYFRLRPTTACNFANAQDRGIVQNWNSDYTAREWLVDCDQKRDQCYFFTRTVAQASFWFDKCIPDGTSIAEIAGVMMTFIERNPQYVDSPATNVLLTALHERWKCPR